MAIGSPFSFEFTAEFWAGVIAIPVLGITVAQLQAKLTQAASLLTYVSQNIPKVSN